MTDESNTRTYPITDHVSESELVAITQAGAERWLKSHGWTRESGLYVSPRDIVTIQRPRDIGRIVSAVAVLAEFHRMSPRKVIAEMQADSRIADALRARRGDGAA